MPQIGIQRQGLKPWITMRLLSMLVTLRHAASEARNPVAWAAVSAARDFRLGTVSRKRTTSPTQVTGDEGGPVTYAIIPGVRRAAVEDEGKRWRATIRLRDGAGEHGNTIPLARSANRSSLITRMPVECRQPRPSVAPSNAGSAKAMGHGTTAICRASRTSSACCVLGSGAAAAVLRTAPGAPPACEPRTSRQPPLSSQYQTHAPDEAARTNPLWLSSPRQAPPICSGDRRLRDRGWAKIHQHYWAKVR